MGRPSSFAPSRNRLTDGTSTGILGVDDIDEIGNMFVSFSRSPKTPAEFIAKKLGRFQGMTKFEGRYVHISVRSGAGLISIFENDESDIPLETFELRSIVNVRKVTVDEDQALMFRKFDDEENEFSENVYGQIVVRLELRDTDSRGNATNGAVHLAFSSVEDRDAWHRWFSELVVCRELTEIEFGEHLVVKEDGSLGLALVDELDAGNHVLTSEDIAAVDKITSFGQTGAARRAVKDYTKGFLQAPVTLGRDTDRDPPNRGKIDVRPPGLDKYVPQLVSARFTVSEVSFEPRKKKRKVLSTKVRIYQTINFSDRVYVSASRPWSTDFEVYDGESVWGFRCKNVEDRNAYVRWMRLVKGRGVELAQTDQETFPYLRAVDTAVAVDEAIHEQVRLQFVKGQEEAREVDIDHLSASGASSGLGSDDDDRSESASDFQATSDDGSMSLGSPQQMESPRFGSPLVSSMRSAVDSPRKRTPRRVEIVEEIAPEEIDTPRSSEDSVHSTRPFTYFPTHFATTLEDYLEETTQIHMIGRRDLGDDHALGSPSGSKGTTLRSTASLVSAIASLRARSVMKGARSFHGSSSSIRAANEMARVRSGRGSPRRPRSAASSASPSPRSPLAMSPTRHSSPKRKTIGSPRGLPKRKSSGLSDRFSLRTNETSNQPRTSRGSFSAHGQVLAAATVVNPKLVRNATAAVAAPSRGIVSL